MAENINALILPIGADATQFKQSINDVKSAYKELSNTIAATPFNLVTEKQKLQLNALQETLQILTKDVKDFGQDLKIPENSILGLTNRIKELNAKKITLDAKTSAAEIARLTKEIERLTAQKNNIDSLGTSVSQIGSLSQTAFKKVENSSKNGRTALTSVSLIAQDLPFGFIAIQNNLPAVISSFGALTAASGGLSGALVALKTALIGPAGLFLAFSVITAGITFAIQKYGSLSDAFNQLTQESNEFSAAIFNAKKSLDEYNKSAKSVNDIRSASLGSVQNEIIKVKTLADVISDSTTSDDNKRRALAELKRTNDEYFGNLDKQKIDLDALNKSVAAYSESLIKNSVAQGLASEAALIYTEFLKQNQSAFDVSQKINKIFKDVPTLTKELDDFTKKRDKLIASGQTSSIRFIPISKELNQYFVLNDQLEEVNERVRTTAKGYESLKNQTESAYKEASKLFNLEKQDKKEPKGRKTKKSTKEEKERLDLLRLTRERIDRQDFLNKVELKDLRAATDERRKIEREAGIITPKQLPTVPVIPINTEKLKENAQIATEALRIIKEEANLEAAYNLAESTFFNPINDLFENFLNTGKFAFKEFGQAVLKAINQIVSRIIATGIISLLFTIFSGGFGAAKGGAVGGFKTVLGLITSSLGFGGPAKIAAPNIANINPGGVQMSGQVVFVQRGSDLVGVLNRTNGTINRVG